MVVKNTAEKQTSVRHLEPEGAYNKFQKFRKSIYMLVHRDPLTAVNKLWENEKGHTLNNLANIKTYQTTIGSEKSI